MAAKVSALAHEHENARLANPRGPVASDLEAIFAPLPRVDRPAPASPSGPASEATRPKARVGPWAIALAIITLLLAAALILVTDPWRLARPAQNAVVPVSRTVPHPRSPPVPVPAAPPSAPAPAASAPAATADETKATRELPSARNPVAATPRATSRPAPASDKPRNPSKTAGEETTAPRAASCPRGASAAWCLRGSVTAADSRLRDAYEDATRVGVNRKILVGIRSDWKHLRGRANKDPEALIRGYALLTQELRAEISRRSP